MSICNKNIIIADIARKGPNGISWVFFNFNIIKDTGRAIKADKKTENIDKGNLKQNQTHQVLV